PGHEVLERLIKSADAAIDTPEAKTHHHIHWPGHPEGSFSYDELHRLNPGLVVASITGFHPGGPYEHFRATSGVAFALSGIMKSIGPPEGPPEPAPGQLPFDLTSVDAASGIVCALLARGKTGRGQHITVAAHEVLASEINPRPPDQFDDTRHPGSANPSLAPSGVFECQGGPVVMFVNLPGHWEGLKQLLGNPPQIAGAEWANRGYRHEHAKQLYELVAAGLADWKQADFVAEAQRLHVPCGPINTMDAFARDAHIAERGFFVQSTGGALGDHRMPGAPYKLNQAGWALRRPAPLLGEDTREVLAELGYSATAIDGLCSRRVVKAQPPAAAEPSASRPTIAAMPPASSPTAQGVSSLPLEGIRVVAFTTAFAGPTVGRYLADLGAEVIKVESRKRWDNTRHASSAGTGGMMEPGGVPTAPGFGYFNRNQLGAAIDLSQDKGREIMRKLIVKTDVIIENFSLQVLRKWGFSYPELQAIKPDIVLLDMQGFGQTGPLKDYISFGSIIHAYSGLASLWGSAHGFFVDYIAAQHAVLAVLSALRHRERTGHGTHIDLAQLETAGTMLGVQYLDYFVNGYVQRYGDSRMQSNAPYGCYRCQGHDSWCFIEVTSDHEWERLKSALEEPPWAVDERFNTAAGRLANRAELDAELSTWTMVRTDREVQDTLQREGVPAAAVVSARDVFSDPHLAATGFYWTTDHQALGPWQYPRLALRLSAVPEKPPRPAPMLGEHNDYIFGEVLGLSEQERAELTEQGVLA
ncbi:MAG TPA: CoA transferase, partial [Chloroflexota bacterium]|nr:CoA transferase [Chloroflexota bacterium]